MSLCKDYTAEWEQGELLELARRYHTMLGWGYSPEDLNWILLCWRLLASHDNVSVLDAGRRAIANFEHYSKLKAEINAEATTCQERRRMWAERLGISLEDYEAEYKNLYIDGALELHKEELRWLQAKVKEGNKELDTHLEQLCEYRLQSFDTSIEDEDKFSDSDLDGLKGRLEEAVIAEKQRLERKLQHMRLKARKPAAFRLKVYVPSSRRARTRAPRSARRASFSMAAASPGGGGDSSGESDQGDPPGPHLHCPFLTPSPYSKHNQEPSRPWLGLGSFRMERGRSA